MFIKINGLKLAFLSIRIKYLKRALILLFLIITKKFNKVILLID